MKKKEFENLGKECFEHLKVLNPKGGMSEFIRMAVEFGYKKAEEKHIKGNCFWGHKWGKWEQYEQPMMNVNYRTNKEINYFEKRQKRICLRCGKIQDNIIE